MTIIHSLPLWSKWSIHQPLSIKYMLTQKKNWITITFNFSPLRLFSFCNPESRDSVYNKKASAAWERGLWSTRDGCGFSISVPTCEVWHTRASRLWPFWARASVVQVRWSGSLPRAPQLINLTLIFIRRCLQPYSHSVSEPPSPDLEVYNESRHLSPRKSPFSSFTAKRLTYHPNPLMIWKSV